MPVVIDSSLLLSSATFSDFLVFALLQRRVLEGVKGVFVILQPLLQFASQLLFAVGELRLLREVGYFVGIVLEVVEFLAVVDVEVVLQLVSADHANRIHPGLFAVVLADGVVALRRSAAGVARHDRFGGLAVAIGNGQSCEIEKGGDGGIIE